MLEISTTHPLLNPPGASQQSVHPQQTPHVPHPKTARVYPRVHHRMWPHEKQQKKRQKHQTRCDIRHQSMCVHLRVLSTSAYRAQTVTCTKHGPGLLERELKKSNKGSKHTSLKECSTSSLVTRHSVSSHNITLWLCLQIFFGPGYHLIATHNHTKVQKKTRTSSPLTPQLPPRAWQPGSPTHLQQASTENTNTDGTSNKTGNRRGRREHLIGRFLV